MSQVSQPADDAPVNVASILAAVLAFDSLSHYSISVWHGLQFAMPLRFSSFLAYACWQSMTKFLHCFTSMPM